MAIFLCKVIWLDCCCGCRQLADTPTVLNGIPYFHMQKQAIDHSWLPPSPIVRIWREKGNGTPKLPEGVLALVLLRLLWENVVVDHTKKNQQKELIWASECLTKQNFIQQGITKYIAMWKSMMERDAMYAKKMTSYVHYWEQFHSEIKGPVVLTPTLLEEGFWPTTNS